MTESERRTLRLLIDGARRATVTGEHSCGYINCGQVFMPIRPNQVYCCKTHKTKAWGLRSEKGREWRARHRLASMRKLRAA